MNEKEHIDWCHKRIEHLEGLIESSMGLLRKSAGLWSTDTPKEWLSLEDEEILDAYKKTSVREWAIGGMNDVSLFARIIESKLKEKNR